MASGEGGGDEGGGEWCYELDINGRIRDVHEASKREKVHVTSAAST
jgi:hypothetical protein